MDSTQLQQAASNQNIQVGDHQYKLYPHLLFVSARAPAPGQPGKEELPHLPDRGAHRDKCPVSVQSDAGIAPDSQLVAGIMPDSQSEASSSILLYFQGDSWAQQQHQQRQQQRGQAYNNSD